MADQTLPALCASRSNASASWSSLELRRAASTPVGTVFVHP
jgi:hypothetical protein